jgi:hypothetical protein
MFEDATAAHAGTAAVKQAGGAAERGAGEPFLSSGAQSALLELDKSGGTAHAVTAVIRHGMLGAS